MRGHYIQFLCGYVRVEHAGTNKWPLQYWWNSSINTSGPELYSFTLGGISLLFQISSEFGFVYVAEFSGLVLMDWLNLKIHEILLWFLT